MILIYITTFIFVIMGFKERNTGELLTGIIFLIGGFIFHLFWETKSQYVYPYVFILIPYSSYTIVRILDKLNSIMGKKEEKTMKPVLYIVIPCYNEEEVLPITEKIVLDKIEALISGGGNI